MKNSNPSRSIYLTRVSNFIKDGIRRDYQSKVQSLLKTVLVVLFSLVVDSASGSLILDSTSGADPASALVTISNLDSTPTAASSGLTFTSTGTVSGSPNLSSSDSFSFSIDAVGGWNATDAAAAPNFATYLSGLSDFNLGTVNSGQFGPRDPGATGNDTSFSAGEALVFTFDTSNLTTPFAELTFESLAVSLTGGDDRADFFFWDSDSNTLLESQVNVNADNAFNGPLNTGPLTTNDILVIAANDPANASNWRVDSLELDVAAVPEPSTIVTLSCLIGCGLLFRRRRKSFS